MSEEHQTPSEEQEPQAPLPVEPVEPVTPSPVEIPPAPAEQAKPVAEVVDWRDRRIAILTKQLHEERAKQRQPLAAAPPSQEDIDARVQAQAQMIAAANAFTERCNSAAEAGRKEFPDFDARVGQLTRMVDANDQQQVQAYNQFLSAALETGEAPRLIHQLGGDLNEAGRILALSPVRMAVELTRMAAKPPVETTQAPRPINPMATAPSNRSTIAPDDPDRADNLSVEEWMRRRSAQVTERAVRR